MLCEVTSSGEERSIPIPIRFNLEQRSNCRKTLDINIIAGNDVDTTDLDGSFSLRFLVSIEYNVHVLLTKLRFRHAFRRGFIPSHKVDSPVYITRIWNIF